MAESYCVCPGCGKNTLMSGKYVDCCFGCGYREVWETGETWNEKSDVDNKDYMMDISELEGQ